MLHLFPGKEIFLSELEAFDVTTVRRHENISSQLFPEKETIDWVQRAPKESEIQTSLFSCTETSSFLQLKSICIILKSPY